MSHISRSAGRNAQIKLEVSALRKAAWLAAVPFCVPNGDRLHYRGCCCAMDVAHTPWRLTDLFAATFRPINRPAYWWPMPSTKNKGRASNGKTYKPSEARCLALLLMAEMVRTGDV